MSRNHRVAVVCFEPISIFEMAVPCEVFGVDRTAMGVPAYDLKVCSASGPSLATNRHSVDLGFTISTPNGVETMRWADTILIPGRPPTADPEGVKAVVRELRRAQMRGARIASFCSGAFALAEAGLLDGKRATTHWMYAHEMAERYPAIEVDPAVLYVGDGQVFTSAGTAAGIDLCLHFVRLDHGAEVANVIARRMVVPPHRDGGQAQYVEAPVPVACEDHSLSRTMEWAERHLDRALTIESLASRAQMSPRTFARRFRAVTGTTPLQWLLTQRVIFAQRLLETTTLPIEHVAEQCGFGSAAGLRQHFGRVMGTSPLAYRQTFRRAG